MNTIFEKEKDFSYELKSLRSPYVKKGKVEKEFTSLFRAFIPVEEDSLPGLEMHFKTSSYRFGTSVSDSACVSVNTAPYVFELLTVKNESEVFLVIEMQEEITLKEFKEYCNIVMVGFGFVCGFSPGGMTHFFLCSGMYCGAESFRPAMISKYYPVFRKMSNQRNSLFEEDKFVLSGDDFGRLISIVYENENFCFILELLLESTSVCSHFLIPGIFAVIIESLSKIICGNESGTIRPLRKNKSFREIKMKFYDLLSGYREVFDSEDDYIKFKRRISELNKPVNKQFLTNMEKLIRPFELLDISLTLEDREIIAHRNDLLHGSFYLWKEMEENKNVSDYMEYVSGRLYTLISALVLKYAGYNGYIVNHPAKEEFYRKI